jgi:hypothetical protein
MPALEKPARSFPAVSNRPYDGWRLWRRDCPWSNTALFVKREPRSVRSLGSVIPGWQRDIVDPDQKATMVKDLVAAFAKAARVSDVPDEAITTDTREPSYTFLAAEWNRSSVSERAYLLAMLFGREFDVEANDLSLQIASLAMTMGEPDGSAPLIARVDLGAASDDNVTRTMAAD